MPARPASLVLAVALLAILVLGFAFAGLVLGAVLLTDAVPSAEALSRAVIGIGAAMALVVAIAGAASAAALWAGRPWGWMGSLAVAILGVVGATVAVSTSGAQVPLLVGLGIAVAAVALLLVPATRDSASR